MRLGCYHTHSKTHNSKLKLKFNTPNSNPHSQLKLKTQFNLDTQLKTQLKTRPHSRFYVVPICICSTKVFLYVLFVCIAIVSKPNSKLNSTINIKFRSQLRTQSSNQFIHTLFSSCTCLRWCECSTITSVVRNPTLINYLPRLSPATHARKPRFAQALLTVAFSATHTRNLVLMPLPRLLA